MNKTLYTRANKKLTTWLKEKREEKGLTMRDLAGRLKLTHSFIAKTEQGTRRLDVVEYLTYCAALEVDPHDGIDVTESSF